MGNVLMLRRREQKRRKVRVLLLKIAFGVALAIGMILLLKQMNLMQEQDAVSEDRWAVGTMGDGIAAGRFPVFFQYDDRWKDEKYGDGTMEFTGCGPTCLSMVVCGLTETDDYDPVTVARLADKWGYYAAGAGSKWTLMSEGAEQLGLTVHEVTFDENHIREELMEGRPIICVVGPGDFTTTGHFIVLCEVEEDGRILIHDPNSEANCRRTWGLDELMPQIKNLWSYS